MEKKVNKNAIDDWKAINNYTNRNIANMIGTTERTVLRRFNHGGHFRKAQEVKLKNIGFDIAWLGISLQETERDDNTRV